MILRAIKGKYPQLHPTVRGAETAVVLGDVALEADVTLWYGAVLRGDVGPIRVGAGSNLQDNCILHCSVGAPVTIGRQVTVGHGAILHSCTVEDGCLIGMGATLLDGCVIGEGSTVGAGALVPPGKLVPPGSLVVGVPGKVVRALSPEECAANRQNAELYVEEGREQLE